MRRISTLILFSLAFLTMTAGKIEFTYNFSNPLVKTKGNFHTLGFENTMLTGKTGEPALPYQAVRLLLPPGEEAISVTYNFENENMLEGFLTIFPQQASQPYSIGSDGIFRQNMQVYSSVSEYPTQAWGEFSTQFMNGHSFLLTTFTPVKYIPAEGRASYFGKVVITVETRSTDRSANALGMLRNSSKISKLAGNLAQNPSVLSAYTSGPASREGEYQVLIITPQQFASYFQELKDLYLVRGFKTEIVTSESIDAQGTGQDLQAKIRNYIITEYQDHGVEHVLLGGDAEHIPYRGFYCIAYSSSTYEDSNIPADLYYSSLDGSWNDDGDGYWAEIGEDDLLPDVSVARFPFSTVSQLQKILHKTLIYQDAPVQGELRNILMAGENLWSDPLTFGEDYLELLIGYRDDNGYITDGMPEDLNYTKLYDSQANWGGSTLVNAINQGKTFVHHSGHANETYVMRLGMSDITNSNFAQTNGTTHNYPFIYTHGCLDGAFDVNDCIGEAMVLIDNFAVGGAFNSRYGWFNEGQTEGPSAHLHREFVDALYHDKECRIGAAHMISKIETSVWVNAPGQWEEGALRWCFYDCNIFGDPMLGVWTDEPIDIVTVYPDEIFPGTTEIPVTVTSQGEPVEGLMCAIMADGNLYACCATDATGSAIIEVPGGFSDVTAAELVVSGYNCLPEHNPLNITVGIDEIKNEISSIRVSPNPFTDQVRLSFSLETAQQVSLRFFQASGQQIDELEFIGREGANEINLDTANWPEGIIQAMILAGTRISHIQLVHIRK